MAVLKGIWTFNETLGDMGYYLDAIRDLGQVNFVSNGESYIGFSEKQEYADEYTIMNMTYVRSDNSEKDAYSFAMPNWFPSTLRVVDFGESEQTVTDAFYTWLTANATLQETEPEEPSTTLKDLTNTTWNVPSGWTATAGYGTFSVEYIWSINDYTNHQILYIGFDGTPEAVANTITDAYLNSRTNSYSFEITFTGGTDTTNPDLIAWLTENGELQGEEEKPIFTYDLTQLNLSAGTYSITIVAKAAGYNDVSSNAVQFVVEQESFVEETNKYGTTMVINKYTEEPNEYGTTMIIGGETTA